MQASQPGPSPFQAAPPPGASNDGSDGASSFQVYALMIGLVGVTFMAMIVAIVAMFIAIYWSRAVPDPVVEMDGPDAVVREGDTAVEPLPVPGDRPVYRAPTGGGGPVLAADPEPPAITAANATFKIPSGVRYTSVEVTCPSGYRKRGSFSGTSATVPGVPTGEGCTANFQGGSPAVARPVYGGKVWTCEFPSSVGVCK